MGVNVGVRALFIPSFLLMARQTRKTLATAHLPSRAQFLLSSPPYPGFFLLFFFFCRPYFIDCIAQHGMGFWILKSCSLFTLEILSLILMLGFREQRTKRSFQSLGEEVDLEAVDV